MKFIEALEKAFKNPGSEFVRNQERLSKVYMKYDGVNLKFSLNDKKYDFIQIEKLDIESDWKPAPKEATWEEAIYALVFEGKAVQCVHESLNKMSTFFSIDYIPVEDIKNGKWYVIQEGANEGN